MKGLIIGIIAVFCLQVALIGDTWLNAKFDPVSAQPSSTLELAVVDESIPEFSPAQLEPVREVARVVRRKETVPARPRFTARRLGTTAAVRKTARLDPLIHDVERVDARPPIAKRSFFAKAWPVIKKPYSWIKTLVSKFD